MATALSAEDQDKIIADFNAIMKRDCNKALNPNSKVLIIIVVILIVLGILYYNFGHKIKFNKSKDAPSTQSNSSVSTPSIENGSVASDIQ